LVELWEKELSPYTTANSCDIYWKVVNTKLNISKLKKVYVANIDV
jgi:hypothetical protein